MGLTKSTATYLVEYYWTTTSKESFIPIRTNPEQHDLATQSHVSVSNTTTTDPLFITEHQWLTTGAR